MRKNTPSNSKHRTSPHDIKTQSKGSNGQSRASPHENRENTPSHSRNRAGSHDVKTPCKASNRITIEEQDTALSEYLTKNSTFTTIITPQQQQEQQEQQQERQYQILHYLDTPKSRVSQPRTGSQDQTSHGEVMKPAGRKRQDKRLQQQVL